MSPSSQDHFLNCFWNAGLIMYEKGFPTMCEILTPDLFGVLVGKA
jgi:hypothetical protein